MANWVLLIALPFLTSPAMAASSLKAVLQDQPAVSDDELAGMRAGFFTAGGAQFDFGASIKTMVNGRLALETSLQWTQEGAVTQQLAGMSRAIASQVNNQVAGNLAQAGITPPNDAVSVPVGNAVQTANAAASTPAAAPAATANPSAVPAESSPTPAHAPTVLAGVEVPGIGGSTQVLANLAPNQIQNIILNSASGQSITQDTNITFTIYNFQAWQQQLAERAVSARLAGDMLAAFAAGH